MPELIATTVCPAFLIFGAGVWAVSALHRLLGRRVDVVVDDPTPDDVMAVADAVASRPRENRNDNIQRLLWEAVTA